MGGQGCCMVCGRRSGALDALDALTGTVRGGGDVGDSYDVAASWPMSIPNAVACLPKSVGPLVEPLYREQSSSI